MIPVVTPEEMGAIDRAAAEPVDVLISRAGGAVARAAIRMLGGTYGRRVVILEGKGNNGNDGREAARRLRARGVQVIEVDAASPVLPSCDLVIDAAYGTGFRGIFVAPQIEERTPVLAVDIPSGIDGLTGEVGGSPLRSNRTVTFAALKPGLLLHPGTGFAGEIEIADIGLDVSVARVHVVEADDVVQWWPPTALDAHKWQSAIWVIAGSAGMEGAATLVCEGAQRAGAGYVRLSSPPPPLQSSSTMPPTGQARSAAQKGSNGPSDSDAGHPRGNGSDDRSGASVDRVPTEVVRVRLDQEGWSHAVLHGLERFSALVVGNGLGTDPATQAEIRHLVAHARVPTIVDADGLTALGRLPLDLVGSETILTPHDGEFERLTGSRPGADRIDAARRLSGSTGAVVLLKGPTTIVAEPGGQVLLSTSGDTRLASAGTGDVLAGVIAALCARGIPPFEAAAAGAFIHGRAGALGWRHGLVAGDLAPHLSAVLDALLPELR